MRTRATRAIILRCLGVLLAASLPARLVRTGPAAAQPGPGEPLVQAVGPVGITVSDMERSLSFYTGIFGFEKTSDREIAGEAYDRLYGLFGCRVRVCRLRLGDEELELTEYLAPRGRPAPADSRSNDLWFQHVALITADMDRAYGELRKHRVEHISPGPQRLPDWNPNAGGIHAFYFRDPDGHPLEVLQFPPDKGDPKWRRKTERLFLGIDHTAIGVGDTERSLAFYRDRLGLRIAGESENYGPEQERLNSVFGARLRITSLRAGAGPGIELLEYLAPRTGRPYPADERPNDLVHWETHLRVTDVPSGSPFQLLGFRTGLAMPAADPQRLLTRDPDGHALLAERAGAPAPGEERRD